MANIDNNKFTETIAGMSSKLIIHFVTPGWWIMGKFIVLRLYTRKIDKSATPFETYDLHFVSNCE